MNRYFTYVKNEREICQKPCVIEFEGRSYTSFCNAWSLALTTESCENMEFYDTDRYPNVGRFVERVGEPKKIDFSKVFADAKSNGYKLTKSKVNGNQYLMHYDGSYFRLGLFDITYRIIDHGGEVTVYHRESSNPNPIIIENELGFVVVMPVRCDSDLIEENDIIVIEAE